jgi:AraC-like DNA-binding protein
MPFWSILYSIAAAQAALLALALWRRPVNTAGNHVLAVWIALVGFDLAVKAVYFDAPAAGLLKVYHFVGLFPFLYGSLFFVYVRALTQARAFGRRDLVHLAGFALVVTINAEVFLQGGAQTEALFAHMAAGGKWPYPSLDVALFAYSLSYVIAALAWVRRYRRRLRQRRSDADVMSLRWIDAMALSQIVIWCIAMTAWLGWIPGIDYPLIYGAVAAWVFVVGYLSLSQVSIAVDPPQEKAPVPADDDAPADTDARFPAVQTRLSQLMAQEQLFREPALTISQLARRSGYPEYLVSLVINRCFNDNFWGYINRLRIEAASACLADGDDARTILDIAYACGFTSKSTFNAAFKRQTGETPSGYRQRHARGTPLESA